MRNRHHPRYGLMALVRWRSSRLGIGLVRSFPSEILSQDYPHPHPWFKTIQDPRGCSGQMTLKFTKLILSPFKGRIPHSINRRFFVWVKIGHPARKVQPWILTQKKVDQTSNNTKLQFNPSSAVLCISVGGHWKIVSPTAMTKQICTPMASSGWLRTDFPAGDNPQY